MSLVCKKFQDLNVTVYGTYDKPLFKAKDVGDLLGIKNIHMSIKDFTDNQKVLSSTDTPGGSQEVIMLTEQGLYKVLMKSRKPIAEKFQDWVCQVVEEIRKTGEYNLNKETKMIATNEYIVDQFDKKSVAYLGLVEQNKDFSIIKYGHTSNIKRRTSAHKQTYGDQFNVSFALESIAHYEIERQIQKHNDLQSRKIKTYNGKEFNELLRIDKNFTIENLIDIMKLINLNISKNISLELEKEKTKQMQFDKEKEAEKTKQEAEKTRQMEIQLKMMEFENKPSTSVSTETQIQTSQETSREEIIQEEPETSTSEIDIQLKTKIYNENRPIINGRLTYIKQGIDKKIPEVIDIFLEEKTLTSENKRDSILVSELFKKFKEWYSEYIVGYTMFITFVKKSNIVTLKPNPTGKKATKIIYRKFVS